MTNPVLEVRSLGRDSWTLLRDARLRALSDSPEAFTSTHQREAGFGRREWEQAFEGTEWVVAVGRQGVVGMAGFETGLPDGAPRHVHSVWVAPYARRQGVFRSLLERIIRIVCDDGDDALFVWVVSSNVLAREAYTQLGFVATGERQPLTSARGLYEARLRLRLDR